MLRAYGSESWKSLKPLYSLLLKQDDKVKAELARSLHLVAKSVHKSVAQGELLNVMNSFLNSKNCKYFFLINLIDFFK